MKIDSPGSAPVAPSQPLRRLVGQTVTVVVFANVHQLLLPVVFADKRCHKHTHIVLQILLCSSV